MIKDFLSPDQIQDPTPEVTKEIVAKMKLLEHEGYLPVMSLHEVLSHGVDTRSWTRDKQN